MFRRILLPSSSGSSRCFFFSNLKIKAILFVRSVGQCLSVDMASYLKIIDGFLNNISIWVEVNLTLLKCYLTTPSKARILQRHS